MNARELDADGAYVSAQEHAAVRTALSTIVRSLRATLEPSTPEDATLWRDGYNAGYRAARAACITVAEVRAAQYSAQMVGDALAREQLMRETMRVERRE